MRGQTVAGTGRVSYVQPCMVIGHLEREQKFAWLVVFWFVVVVVWLACVLWNISQMLCPKILGGAMPSAH